MKKVIILLLIIFMISFLNLTIIMTRPAIAVSPLTEGLKGEWQGKFICHCPDDAGSCYCNYSE